MEGGGRGLTAPRRSRAGQAGGEGRAGPGLWQGRADGELGDGAQRGAAWPRRKTNLGQAGHMHIKEPVRLARAKTRGFRV